ncbi:MAG: hypothetical protein JWM83_2251 [Candidatus Angelobacter sp.]|nr:hypothetical protein [Candidatus Angelobacter sp.]
MLSIVQVVTTLLVAVTMSMAVAHALEFPGKMRLDKQIYLAVQTIYYPGFTIGGFAEPLSMIATLLLLWMTPTRHPAFWLTLIAFIALVVTHAIFWTATQPANRFWLKNQQLKGLGHQFFSTDPTTQLSGRLTTMLRIGKECGTNGSIHISCGPQFV